MNIDPKLRAMIVCPQCRGDLADEADTLVCTACRLAYPVNDGVPALLVDEARSLS